MKSSAAKEQTRGGGPPTAWTSGRGGARPPRGVIQAGQGQQQARGQGQGQQRSYQQPQHQSKKRGEGHAYYDKKDLAQFVLELKQATEIAKVEAKFGEFPDGNVVQNSLQIPKISAALECMGGMQLPLRQPSWCKEVSAAILIIGLIPAAWLSAADFANISRFITRASVEKQLSISTDELLGVYKLLFGFLQRGGRGCRDDVLLEGLGESVLLLPHAGAQVVHEVMRGMAQILLIRNDRLMRYRLETLEMLVGYCDPRGGELESKHAAIDAIGASPPPPSPSPSPTYSPPLLLPLSPSHRLLPLLHPPPSKATSCQCGPIATACSRPTAASPPASTRPNCSLWKRWRLTRRPWW